MTYEKIEPEIVEDTSGLHNKAYTIKHPAYGNVVVTKPQGTERKLFGSDLKHSSTVRLEFTYAEEDRHLNSSWVRQKARILEVEMTEAQWAHFVASAGMGSGTPVTILAVREGDYKNVPGIKSQRTAKEKASKEFAENIEDTVEKAEVVLSKLQELITKGKASKKELTEISALVKNSIGRFQADSKFSVDMFEEAMENLVETARIEIETSIMNTAQRIGAEHMGISFDSKALENKGVDDE